MVCCGYDEGCCIMRQRYVFGAVVGQNVDAVGVKFSSRAVLKNLRSVCSSAGSNHRGIALSSVL